MEVFVTLYKVVLTHMKAIERYFHAVQFITLSREVLTSAPLNEASVCDHSNESYQAGVAQGAPCFFLLTKKYLYFFF